MFDDDMIDGKDPRRGWNRAVVQYRSRKPYKPSITIDDLLMPNGFGNLRMFWTSLLMAGIMTLLYVWIPLIFLNVFVPLGGVGYAAALGGALVAFTAFLYIAGTRETQRDRDLGARL
jgi:membrane associated rhomboid family serine protease